jgi:predicted nucleotidyltransferase
VSWRRPPFDTAIAELEAYVRGRYAPVGVIVSGSIVRGEAGPTSDFDVFVIHDEPWRVREQKRFSGVPAELFVNPPSRVRGYFANEHADARPCTAHMLATGEVLGDAAPVVHQLIAEAKDWLTKPLEPSAEKLAQLRYGPVDLIDDARDVGDPATQRMLLADAVRDIVAYAFWARRERQPRRKRVLEALAAIDPQAADMVRRWRTVDDVAQLARHVLGVDTFFEWTSARD